MSVLWPLSHAINRAAAATGAVKSAQLFVGGKMLTPRVAEAEVKGKKKKDLKEVQEEMRQARFQAS